MLIEVQVNSNKPSLISKLNLIVNFFHIQSSFYYLIYLLSSTLHMIPLIISIQQSESYSLVSYVSSIFKYFFNTILDIQSSNSTLTLILNLIIIFFLFIYFSILIMEGKKITIGNTIHQSLKIKLLRSISFVIYNFSIFIFLWNFNQFFQFYNNNIVSQIGSSIIIITLFIFLYFIQKYQFSSDACSPYLLAKLPKKFAQFQIIFKYIMGGIALVYPNYWIMLICSLFLLGLAFYQLKSNLTNPLYFNEKSQNLFQKKLIIQICILTYFISQFCSKNVAGNVTADFVLIICMILSIICLDRYKQNKQLQLVCSQQQKILNQNTAVNLVLALIKLYHNNKVQNFKSSLISDHMKKCNLEECYCKNTQYTQNQYFNHFVEKKIAKISQIFNKNYIIKAICLNFRLSSNNYKNKIQHIFKNAQLNNQKNESYIQAHMQLQLKQKILRFIYELNRQYKKVNLQYVFKQQVLNKNMKNLLIKIFQLMRKKYQILSYDLCNYNELDQVCTQINNNINIVEAKWKQEIKNENVEYLQLFLLYFECILESPTISLRLINQIKDKTRKINRLKSVKRQNISIQLQNPKACVIQSEISQNLNKVSNISKNCYNVLQIQKQQIIGYSISKIMPRYLEQGHQKSLQNWLKGQRKTYQKKHIPQFIYTTLSKVSFKGSVQLKCSIGINKLNIYVLIIRQNDNDYLVFNDKGIIQGIGIRLLKQGIFIQKQIGLNIQNFTRKNFIRDKFKKQNLQSVVIQQYKQKSTQTLMPSMTAFEQKKVFCSSVQARIFHMGKTKYYGLKFFDIKQTSKKIQSFNISKNIQNSNQEKNNFQQIENERDSLIYDEQEDMTNIEERFKTYKTIQDPKQQLGLHDDNQQLKSLNKSVTSTSVISFNKFVEQLKRFMLQPNKISSKELRKTTILLILLTTLIIGTFFGLQSLFTQGFNSCNMILFADGAVSDNNQMLQFMYNNILMSQTYCKDIEEKRCKHILKSNKLISEDMYSLYQQDISVFLKNKTTLTGLLYYQSYELDINFTINKVNITISRMQFMQYYYSALKRVESQSLNGNPFSIESKQAIKIIFDNWSSMKQMNHEAITFYQSAAQKQIFLQVIYLTLVFVGIVMIAFYYGYITNNFYKHQQQAKQQIIMIHKQISRKSAVQLIKYYSTAIKYIQSKQNKLDKQLIKQFNISKDKTTSMVKYDKEKKYLYFILVFQILFLLVCYLALNQVIVLIQPTKSMIKLINLLMDSQNYQIQKYFQLKSYYLSGKNKVFQPIQQQLDGPIRPQTDFTTISQNAINMFTSIDSSFNQQFTQLLVGSICHLTQKIFKDWQVAYCKNGTHFQIMESGVNAAMNLMDRKTMVGYIDLKSNQSLNATQYFTDKIYQDLDDYQFYMFRIYQATQARMYQTMTNSIILHGNTLNIYNYIAIFLFLLTLAYWFFDISSKKLKYARIYGIFIQFPQKIVERKGVFTKFTQIFHIDF